MATVITQEEVTVQCLIAHLTENGLSPDQLNDTQIKLRTESGIGYRITIAEDRQFIRFHTYLPTSKAKDRQEKLVFVHQLSFEIFLPSFCLDANDDVRVFYVMPYQFGLIADQFTALVHRFSSLLEYLVLSYDTNGMFDFGPPTVGAANEEPLQSPLVRPKGPLLH